MKQPWKIREVPLPDSHFNGGGVAYAERLSYNTPCRNIENFVHRSGELRDVSEMLKSGISVVLRGVGGIGKTSIAAALYSELDKSFKKIAWIKYDKDLKTSLLANVRPPFETDDIEQRYGAIKNLLSQLGCDSLIVIDNLGKLTKNDRDFLSGLHAVKLATSRLSKRLLKDCNFAAYDIEPMNEDECTDMFYEYYIQDETRASESTVREIVRLAGRHTLLVELLARSLNILFDSPETFLKKLREDGFDCSNAKVASGFDGEEKTVRDHLIKLYSINEFDSVEKSVLRCFSSLPSSPVPLSVMELTGFDVNLIEKLTSLGWLSRISNGYTMYDVIRESVRRQGDVTWDDIAPVANAVCSDSYIDRTEAYEISYPKYLIAFDAAQFALSLRKFPSTAIYLFDCVGWYARHIGNYDKALDFIQMGLEITKDLLGENHPNTAYFYNAIGAVYKDMGKYGEALDFFQKALKIAESVLGENHPDTASSYNNIGAVYYDMGKYIKALEFYNKALEIRKSVLSKNHPNTAHSYNNIGSVYASMGEYDGALDFFQKALKIAESVLGNNHPDTAMSYNNIGNVYYNMGEYDTALEFHNRALNIKESVLGENHPDTAMSYNNVGNVYYNTGEYDTALEFYNRALKIFKEKLGENHPHTKQVQESIDNLKKADAEKDLTSNGQEPDIAETPSEEAHPDISEQCGVIESADNYKNALARCEDELRSAESRFGGNSHEAAKAYDKTGDFYLENGKLDEALEYYETAYGIFKKIHGESHSDTERVREKIEDLEAAE